jgi:hypothetical protein
MTAEKVKEDGGLWKKPSMERMNCVGRVETEEYERSSGMRRETN